MSETDKLARELGEGIIADFGRAIPGEARWPLHIGEVDTRVSKFEAAIREDEQRKVIEECCQILCNDCARGNVPKWHGGFLVHNESGLSCGATLIRRHFKLPEVKS